MSKENIKKYIHHEAAHNLVAPEIIVPVLMDVLNPASVVDVGCGIGTFLHVFKKAGVEDVLGYDGTWVNLDQLSKYLAPAFFKKVDLEKTLVPERTFDLALCLEVAEHLHPDSADNLVQTLTSLSSSILFAAAVPGQKGQNHINEQWPEYWQEKFSKYGYIFHDVLRPIFWNNRQVPRWYKQNMFLLLKEGKEKIAERFKPLACDGIRSYVHPEYFSIRVKELEHVQKNYKTLNLQFANLVQGKEPLSRYLKIFTKAIIHRIKPIQ